MSADGPWLPLYYERLLSSRKVRKMEAKDFGIYLALLIEEWMEGGPLPDDDDELAVAGRAPIQDVRRILNWCFILTQEGWINETLENVRNEQLRKHEIASRAGKVGAEARWGKPKRKKPQGENGNRMATPLRPQCDSNGTMLCDPNGIRGEEKKEEENKKTPAVADVDNSLEAIVEPIIRERFWNGPEPPVEGHKIEADTGIFKSWLKQKYAFDDLVGALRLREGNPITLKAWNVTGKRNELNHLIGEFHKTQRVERTKIGNILADMTKGAA